ncbi:MAG: undecaprenyl-diphosphate phosphatase [Phycisphaerales bacterium]|nr:undecaprenyl-diphosphate phosphatase [Phycisphaerales bacterium]
MINPETMTLVQAIILGVVEGITEYLPVSSTGHLIIVSDLLGLGDTASQRSAVDTFNIVVQGGAILAVLGLYFPRIVQMLKGLVGKDQAGLKLALNIIVAFLPAAVLGVLFNDFIEEKLFNTPAVISALALGGVFMIALDKIKFKKIDSDDDPSNDITELSWKQALFIGFMQTVAMWPGTSRSMMTIAGGVIVGLKPKQAAEFSFLLGLPTLGGACVYSLAKNLKNASELGTPNMFETLGWTPIIIGIIVATISAALAIRWLVGFLNKHGLALFGYYRLALAALLGTLIAAGAVSLDNPDEQPTIELEQ